MKKETKKSFEKRKKSLFKKAWKIYSLYVRKTENGICFTCGKKSPINKCHAGHFIHGALDFDEFNINCQCVRCNKFLHGNLGVYGRNIIKYFGIKIFEELFEMAKWNTYKKYTSDYLEKIIRKYSE